VIIRKDEMATIKRIMADVYDDDETYIKTFWEAVEGFLKDRECYVVLVGLGATQIAYAPFYGISTAKAQARAFAGSAGHGLTVRLAVAQPANRLRLKPDEATMPKKPPGKGKK
jgi:hypothetical protein